MGGNQLLDSLLPPTEYGQGSCGAALGLGTIERSIDALEQHQRPGEMSGRLFRAAVQQRCLTQRMRQR